MHTPLSPPVVEVSLSNNTYNATEGDYVVICAVIKGTVEGELPFNIEVEARTAEGKTFYSS